MKKLLLTGLCLVFAVGAAVADWQPSDPHKMTLPQLPDPMGWDVHFEDYIVADDFECSESGPLSDIHFWISWEMDYIGDVADWEIYIFGDFFGLQPDQAALYWQLLPPYDYEIVPAGAGSQGWLYPDFPPGFPDDHSQYFQVNITNIAQAFEQTAGEVYWLLIRAPSVMGEQNVGWKTSLDSFGSNALWLADMGSWLWYPVEPDFGSYVNMAFVVTNDEPPGGDNCGAPLAVSLGLGDLPWSNSNTTCLRVNDYQETCLGSYDNGEDIIYELTVLEAMEVDITLDPLGTQWTGVAIDDVCPPDGTCLGSSTSDSGSPHKISGMYLEPGVYYIIIDTWPPPDCIADFVLTISEAEYGACCLNTGDCVSDTEYNCDALGGYWQGGETVCEPNSCEYLFGACCLNTGDCVSDLMENACDALGGHWQGGETVCEPYLCEPFYCDSTWSNCPSPDDWITNVTFNIINNDSGDECATGSYGDYTHLSTQVSPASTHTLSVTFESGTYTQYVRAWVDWNQDYDFDDPCEQYDVGSGVSTTVSTDIIVPVDALLGPTRMRVTERYNQYAGPCENGTFGETEDYTVEVTTDITKWIQVPDLSSAGMDVNATKPAMLGDDFECTQTGFVTEIIIWGSWFNDELPSGDANAVVFTLKIYSDDPCGPAGYSEPNEPLWEKQLGPGEFEVVRYAEGLDEGWYEPKTSVYTPSADTVCWWYNFNFNECDAFFQRGTAYEPIVYWLVVQAEPSITLPSIRFGWKNSIDHWNDAAVASFDDGASWSKLEQPPGTELDMAFMIIGKPPSADLNRDGIVDFKDLAFLASQWLTSGP